MIESKHYNADFYADQQNGSYLSAQRVLPIVNAVFKPASVVDVGCGVGYWLKVWKEETQVKEVKGIEGPYVTPAMLKVDPAFVQFQDLKEPVKLDRKFDLAMSLEVAEHLPASHAEQFVQSLTSLSNVVLFSAAVIGQEGTYHINEQMPEYWSNLFQKFGFVPVDYISSPYLEYGQC
ncbi:methyltransferase domain-containing protein [Niastella sp. OAS944]|uniref:methyltransferase domain-containing protein n=1 Tax=Niastella sp. OAS944 TaxID=2664089 RepID=UPI00348F3B1F